MPKFSSRIQSIFTHKSALAALAILPLAAAARPAQALLAVFPFTYTGGSAHYQNDAGLSNDPTAVLAGVGTNPITLSASAAVPAATYTANAASAYFLEWDGTINPSAFHVGDILTMKYDFFINITGTTPGDGNVVVDSTIGSAPLLIHVDNFAGPITHIKGTVSEPITSALTSNAFDVVLSVAWLHFSPNAVLNISVPAASSVDLSVAALVPEPASLSLFAGAVGMLMLKRRTKHA